MRGKTHAYKGQVYVAAREIPHTRRDGKATTLIVWASRCADCGGRFTFTLPAKKSHFAPSRRCASHKRPGARVKS